MRDVIPFTSSVAERVKCSNEQAFSKLHRVLPLQSSSVRMCGNSGGTAVLIALSFMARGVFLLTGDAMEFRAFLAEKTGKSVQMIK